MLLTGEYQNKMDSKKRISIPAKLREILGKTVVITRGLDQCLFVYPTDTWNEFAEKVNKLPLSQESGRSFARLIFSGAQEVEIDNLGRILIPDYLKDYASLEKEVVIIGTGSRLEIWNKDKWEKYRTNEIEELDQRAEMLKEFGI
jgi:MraZ protein